MTQPQVGFPNVPISPADLQAAREGTAQRGGRIVVTLGFLAALTLLSTALSVWASNTGAAWHL